MSNRRTKPKTSPLLTAVRCGNGTHVLYEANLDCLSIYRGDKMGSPEDGGYICISMVEVPDLIQALEHWMKAQYDD